MNYQKPEVVLFGNASQVIEILAKSGLPLEGAGQLAGPAFDLDE